MNQKKESVRQKFSELPEVDFYDNLVGTNLKPIEKAILEKYDPTGKILDIGCAAGRVSIELAKQGYDVTGVDFSDSMIKRAKKNDVTNHVNFQCIDIEKFQLKKYNAILLLDQFIEHIPTRKDRIKLLKRLGESLNKTGIIILTCHERNINFVNKLMWKLKSKNNIGDTILYSSNPNIMQGSPMNFHVYSKEEIEDDIASAELRIIERIPSKSISTTLQKSYNYFYILRQI